MTLPFESLSTKEKRPLWDLLSLVGVSDVRWNTIETSLILMYRKLIDLEIVEDGRAKFEQK